MKIDKLSEKDYNKSDWSGGYTTELFIFPNNSDYKKRDFAFRISSAVINVERSNFTKLDGVERQLIVLGGQVILNINGKSIKLRERDSVKFFGSDITTSYGMCRDFNLMTKGQTYGKLEVKEIRDRVRVNIKSNWDFYIVYVINGKIKLNNYVGRSNELLIVSHINENQVVTIENMNDSDTYIIETIISLGKE